MRRSIEPFAIGLIAIGIVGLCQPWSFPWYRYAFPILLAGTLLFIVASHLPRR